jgi:hypothetical protein
VSKTGYTIHMRGLPFEVKIEDVHEVRIVFLVSDKIRISKSKFCFLKFFKPYLLANVQLGFSDRNRFSGEADVDFYTQEDAQAAMTYDRRHIGKRYIELFLDTKPKQERSDSNASLSIFDQVAKRPELPKLLDIPTGQQQATALLKTNSNQNFSNYFDAIKSLTQQPTTSFDTYSQQAAAAAAYAYSTNMQNYQQYYTQNYQANSNGTSGYNSYPF